MRSILTLTPSLPSGPPLNLLSLAGVLGCTNFPVCAAAGEAQDVSQLLLEQYTPPPTM